VRIAGLELDVGDLPILQSLNVRLQLLGVPAKEHRKEYETSDTRRYTTDKNAPPRVPSPPARDTPSSKRLLVATVKGLLQISVTDLSDCGNTSRDESNRDERVNRLDEFTCRDRQVDRPAVQNTYHPQGTSSNLGHLFACDDAANDLLAIKLSEAELVVLDVLVAPVVRRRVHVDLANRTKWESTKETSNNRF
jgi:hypothetical protein